MKLLQYIPLSIAVIAGRTAWQSFHKGGNYKNPTDNITEDDYNFLSRLFNKFKHLSVSEHIKYHLLLTEDEYKKIEHLDEGYLLKKKIDELYYITIDMRFILENINDDEINLIVKELPDMHIRIIKNESYKNTLILEKGFSKVEFENVELMYHMNTGISDYLSFVTVRIKNISRAMLQELVRHDDFLSPTIKSTRYTLKELKSEDEFITPIPIEHGIITKKYDFERAAKYVKLTNNEMINKIIINHLDDLRVMINSSIANDITKYVLPEAYLTEGIFTLPIRNLKNMVRLRDSKDALWEFQEVAKQLKELLEFLEK